MKRLNRSVQNPHGEIYVVDRDNLSSVSAFQAAQLFGVRADAVVISQCAAHVLLPPKLVLRSDCHCVWLVD